MLIIFFFSFFFFNATAPTEIYTLSLHDALPISGTCEDGCSGCFPGFILRFGFLYWPCSLMAFPWWTWRLSRSEEHTSELQSRFDLVCRLLLEKKKNKKKNSK